MPDTKADPNAHMDVDTPDLGRLEVRASRLAEEHIVSRRPGVRPSPVDRLERHEGFLREAYERFLQSSEAEDALSYTAEWLLDNFYVVQEAARQIRENLPEGYYRRLPKLDTTGLRGYPRIFAIALDLIEYGRGRLDMDRATRFVHAYQQINSLTMGELWALPTMLRLGVVELLTRTVARATELEVSNAEPFSAGVSLPDALTDDTVVANCITSLRMLAVQDWKTFFEDVSRVEEILRFDPANVYSRMDFDTRDRYRKVVEELAMATGQEEEQVAWEAVTLALKCFTPELQALPLYDMPRDAHVGHYLLDQGRADLEACLGYEPPWHVRLRRWVFDHATLVYLDSIGLLTLIVIAGLITYTLAVGGTLSQLVGVALFFLLPAMTVAVSLVNWLVTRIVPSRVLPKMDFSAGVPAESQTMVVIPALLASSRDVEFLIQQLELHFLSNTDAHIHFALLSDFADAPQEKMPEDDMLLEQAKAGVQALNQKYGQDSYKPFYLFHRRRQWNPSEDCWMAWERKRGKLQEFNHLILGQGETSFVAKIGDLDVLPEIRCVITLDADTTLPRGSAHSLIATLAHPLNRAQFDADDGTVVAGYTILQPRTEIKPTSANQSLFTRVFSGDTGLDLYTRAVSDVYQDLFGEGTFVGKGIYDVAAFDRSLADRVPENALLSHDLFEGIHGRAGLVTDVVLYEDYPPSYLTYADRQHRWVRGDWQLLPWLLPQVPHAEKEKMPNQLSALDRWKILDNLRRSLIPPMLIVFLVAGWLWLPGPAWVWMLLGIGTLGMPLVTSAVAGLIQGLAGESTAVALPTLRLEAARWLLALIFLPYQALLMVDAIGTTLVRLTISHKRRLQWTTAAHTVYLFGRQRRLAAAWRRMGGVSLVALGIAVLTGLIAPGRLLVAGPLLLGWLISPLVAHWISRTGARQQTALSADQRRRLRRLARRTWLYFERFVGPDDHWLPPDHFQERPRGLTAHRTSPTNVGLLLLSILSAYELGYIGLMDLTLRLRAAFETMDALERYRGHFLNWYDTSVLKPLPPRYVSSVDSGNLAACLLALKQGLQSLPRRSVLRWQRWQGLLDTLDELVETVESLQTEDLKARVATIQDHLGHIQQQVLAAQDTPGRWASLLAELRDEEWDLDRLLMMLLESNKATIADRTLRDLRLWSEQIHSYLSNMWNELNLLLPWFDLLSNPPEFLEQHSDDSRVAEAWRTLQDTLYALSRLDEMPEGCRAARAKLGRLDDVLDRWSRANDDGSASQVEEARAWCEELAEALDSARITTEGLLIGLQNLAVQAESYFETMDFAFLFDRQRHVFHIGYDVTSGALSTNYYDLLASEARIASLVSIAKGDVPQNHWLHMARPLSRIDGTYALLSWNGSMFEYLMPPLLMKSYDGTLLDQAYQAAVKRQIAYARRKAVPWGISESGYYRFDANQNYQYRGFGVPGLGRKRGLGEDLVITPYASLLALPVRPQAVIDNIDHLVDEGMLGHYGFYEAVDYTRSRLPLGQEHAIVRSYMSHHQGMIMLALTNCLEDELIVRYFHADPLVQSVQMLLQEQVPQQVSIEDLQAEAVVVSRTAQPRVELRPWPVSTDGPLPWVHFLSNGRYSTLISSAGSGYSRYVPGGVTGPSAGLPHEWEEIDLTRWHADTTLDSWGLWIYVQDRDSGALWSAGYQPTASPPDEQSVFFHAHKAEFRRRDHDISLRMEIAVPLEDDVEIRHVFLINHRDRPRHLTVTSYGEVVLAPQITDRRHPAFNKLFIESEYVPELNALLFRRRPRSAEELPIYLAHMLVVEDGRETTGAHEGDRAHFLGRGRTPRTPAALVDGGQTLSGSVGATLDPIMALSQEIDLEPHAETQVAYVTLVAGSRQEALNLARRYRTFPAIGRAFDRARAQSEDELRRHNLDTAELERFDQLLSVLLYPHAALRAEPNTLAANRRGQSSLWPYTISGDYPILLVRVDNAEETVLVQELLRAHAYWRDRQIKIDLVLLNQRDTGYDQKLHDRLDRLITHMDSDGWLNRRGGIFLLRVGQMTRPDQTLLESAARAVLNEKDGTLAEQLGKLHERSTLLPRFVPALPGPEDVEPTPSLACPTDLVFDNGLGGFSADGREYVIYLEEGQQTPAPWINVVANPNFGFIVSESGGGYTWALNSGENRLTPWRNDPVSDTPGEALYLRDEETGQIWSPAPSPVPAPAPYLIRHGAGYSVFEHHSHGLKQRLCLFAAPDAPVKVVHLRLENAWNRARRITATFYAEWVLGTSRDTMQQYVVPEYDADAGVLLARNPYNEGFGERVAFAAASKDLHGLTADRAEFLGRDGSVSHPAALDRIGLSGTVKVGPDPCAALQIHLDLSPGESQEAFFLLGQGADREEALRLVRQYQDAGKVTSVWESVNGFWDKVLGTVTVETPDPAMDLLLNRWLLYQALACRVWARSALYQSSGAYGYRDQLQDVMALVHAAPEVAREHILRAARHQFEAGDVLHWWHPPSGRGIRSRITDDLLWLPYVTAHYVETTGDETILSEKTPFVRGQPLAPEEAERYGQYEVTEEEYTLYEHCRRALDKGRTAGQHGLPLMGSGDWNDGMNRVGIEGQGESVWLGWFLSAALNEFAAICERMDEHEQAAEYLHQAMELGEALGKYAWDGEWYRRAYYDDGTLLGSSKNDECQIDSIAQSWAVLSGAADQERAEKAMEALDRHLVRRDNGLMLLAPPFDETPRDPGYIKGYPPGIRENGGQYTHAALWAVWAFAELGQGDRAGELFRLLNPIHHASSAETVARYRVEPYVVAADVYGIEPHVGRGGWTWYTGSGGWMYRLGVEAILGLHRAGGTLRIDPCIPRDWSSYELAYRNNETTYHIRVENPDGINRGVKRVTLDGEELVDGEIPLVDDGQQHEVHVVIGRAGEAE